MSTRANALRWAHAPGVRTGYYAWAVRDGESERAHAYRTKTRVVHGVCGYSFGGKVAFPGDRAEMCEACRAKILQMEIALLGQRPAVKERAHDDLAARLGRS